MNITIRTNGDLSYQRISIQLGIYERELRQKAFEVFGHVRDHRSPPLTKERTLTLLGKYGVGLIDLRALTYTKDIANIQAKLDKAVKDGAK